MAVAISVLVAACGSGVGPDDEAGAGTIVTVAADAIDWSALDGQTVSGVVTVEFRTSASFDEVRFYFDGDETPVEIATERPFRWVLDTTLLEPGEHQVAVRTPDVSATTGERLLAAATFRVEPADEGELPPEEEDPSEIVENADYFVAPWGSDGGVGSLEDPFASLRPVADVVEPGDVVLLRGGVYDDLEQVYYRVYMSGAEGAPVTVRSYPGEHAVLDGWRHPWHPRSYGDGRSVNDPMLLEVYGDYLVFEDLTFRNGVGNGFYFVGYYNVLRRITSHDNHAHGVKFQGSYNLLEYVTSFGNDSVANGGNSANGISLTDGSHVGSWRGEDAETRGNVIRYALLYENSDDGLGTWNSWDTLIEYSVSFGNGIGPTGNGTGFKLGGGERADIGTVARFNLAWGNIVNFNTNTSTGVTLLHNTSWNVRDEGIGFALTVHSIDADENAAFNNVSFEDRWPRARGDETDDRFNSWNVGVEDPEFLSVVVGSSGFLALREESPVVDVGMDVGLTFADGAPDLGALQVGDRVSLVATEAAELGRIEWHLGEGTVADR